MLTRSIASSATSITANNFQVIDVDSTTAGAPVTVDLPAVGNDGVHITVINRTGGQTVTLDAAGADTINGAGTLALLATAYNYAHIVSASGEWILLDNKNV